MDQNIYQMILDFLHITQTPDKSSVRRIQNEINSGITFIKTYCDNDATCRPGTESGALLCEYVLRAESGAAATFEADFAQDIVQMQVATDVRKYLEAIEDDPE